MAVEDLQIQQHPSKTVLEGGRTLVTLALSPGQLSERAPLDWSDGADDLDEYRAATVSTGVSSPVFVLVAYRRDPQQGTSIVGSPSTTTGDVDELLQALQVRPSEIVDRTDGGKLPSRSLELSLEAEDLRRQITELAAEIGVLTSAMTRLRENTADQLRDALDATQAVGEKRERLLLIDMLRSTRISELSARQREVLRGVLDGATVAEIAAQLDVKENTVRTHLRALRNRAAHPG